MEVSNTIKYVGVFDKDIDLFEGQYKVPNGISYNSYVIIDEKAAVMDSVDKEFGEEWIENIKNVLGDKSPDYLIVQHMEPDHSANIVSFINVFPEAKIVSSAKAFTMMKGFFGTDFPDKQIVVKEGDTLNLGSRELSFVAAPMVHWPEVIMTYDAKEKTLFTADAFGKFGACDLSDGWTIEARRYYIGIVGKYGAQVQSLLKKASALDIQTICPLHGPVLKENIPYYVGLYNTWSSYTPEEDGILIAYTSIYGNTEKAVNELSRLLESKGEKNVVVRDLARCDISEAVGLAFKYSKTVFATTTYNADIFPFMKEFINHLTERNFSKRTVAFIENGSWAPMAAKVMKGMLENSKELTYLNTTVKINSALDERSKTELNALANELCEQN
ncbi:MAG: FprA family A-type flavoprotein [Ruminococcaceae bacterium]|nr:FprA family A-type flavoprotein [Oscillospiraceae bacterium]